MSTIFLCIHLSLVNVYEFTQIARVNNRHTKTDGHQGKKALSSQKSFVASDEYLIGQKFGGQTWRKFGSVLKILSFEFLSNKACMSADIENLVAPHFLRLLVWLLVAQGLVRR